MDEGRSTTVDAALRIGLIGSAYFGIAYLGLQLASVNPSATPIWPATGFAIAAVLLWGYQITPAIFIGAFLVNYFTAGSPVTSLAIACGNTLEAAATTWLVRRWATGSEVFDSPVGVGKFALISAATTTISATIGVASLLLSGLAQAANAPVVWLTWWLGDFAGAVVIAPMVVLWLNGMEKVESEHDFFHAALVYLSSIVVGIVVFSPLFLQTPLRDPLGFLAVAPLLWAALSRGPRDTATVAAILSSFAVWGTIILSGPFARATLNDSFLLLLMFMVSTSIPSLALSADIRARQRAQDHQALLLKELSHRVGNTLAVLNSVFRRSARHARSLAELEEGFQGRLMSLAETHRLLGESNWESASVMDLIKTTVEPYCPPDYDGCEYRGEELRITGSVATALTMVLHELATNAAKHGALRSKGGRLRIGWLSSEESSGERMLRIEWEEVLPVAPSLNNKPGYGTAFIDTTIATLRGQTERVHTSDGLTVRLAIPVG